MPEDRNALKLFLDKKKGLICNEFEKLCPTDKSFQRETKQLHDVFDDIQRYIEENYKNKE